MTYGAPGVKTGAPLPSTSGLLLLLLRLVFAQQEVEAGVRGDRDVDPLDREVGDRADHLIVGVSRGARRGGESAGVGEIGVGVALEDEDVPGGGVEAHVDARVVAAVE